MCLYCIRIWPCVRHTHTNAVDPRISSSFYYFIKFQEEKNNYKRKISILSRDLIINHISTRPLSLTPTLEQLFCLVRRLRNSSFTQTLCSLYTALSM